MICGSIARHWLGALLGLLAGKYIPHDVIASVPLLTDDMVANGLVALGAAAVPISHSIWTGLQRILRERLGLRMSAGMTEREVSNVIAEAPKTARVAAILTADPLKL
jgi:hypothetical protein